MHKITTAVAALALATGVSVGTGTAAAAATGVPHTGTYEGCPVGYVCIYPNAGWNGGLPLEEHFARGSFTANAIGVHRILNNTTAGTIVRICEQGSGFPGCTIVLAGSYDDYDFLPPTVIEVSS